MDLAEIAQIAEHETRVAKYKDYCDSLVNNSDVEGLQNFVNRSKQAHSERTEPAHTSLSKRARCTPQRHVAFRADAVSVVDDKQTATSIGRSGLSGFVSVLKTLTGMPAVVRIHCPCSATLQHFAFLHFLHFLMSFFRQGPCSLRYGTDPYSFLRRAVCCHQDVPCRPMRGESGLQRSSAAVAATH